MVGSGNLDSRIRKPRCSANRMAAPVTTSIGSRDECATRVITVPDTRVPTRRLGSTELTVSRLGLGLAALGRPAYINLGRQRDLGPDRSVAELKRRCHAMLDAARWLGSECSAAITGTARVAI